MHTTHGILMAKGFGNKMKKFKQGEWNLTELVRSSKDPSLAKQLLCIQKNVKKFEQYKKALKSNISTKLFAKILKSLEDISEKVSVVSGYASLWYSADTQSDEATSLMTKMSQFSTEIENTVLFFDQWWKKEIDQKNAERLIKSSGQLYEFLKYKRLLAKYSLSESEEKIINLLDVTGSTALVKLYDKITNNFQYIVNINGKKKIYNREQLALLVRSNKSRTREVAYKALLSQYQKNKGVLGEIYQNLVLNWKNESLKIRGYSSPISVRNIANNTDDKTVDSLLTVCKNNLDIFQRYFAHKGRMLGIKKLRRYDLYAPAVKKIKQKKYSFDQGIKLVLNS